MAHLPSTDEYTMEKVGTEVLGVEEEAIDEDDTDENCQKFGRIIYALEGLTAECTQLKKTIVKDKSKVNKDLTVLQCI
jgi:hypothetical protein